jgi:hypothetical protein
MNGIVYNERMCYISTITFIDKLLNRYLGRRIPSTDLFFTVLALMTWGALCSSFHLPCTLLDDYHRNEMALYSDGPRLTLTRPLAREQGIVLGMPHRPSIKYEPSLQKKCFGHHEANLSMHFGWFYDAASQRVSVPAQIYRTTHLLLPTACLSVGQ